MNLIIFLSFLEHLQERLSILNLNSKIKEEEQNCYYKSLFVALKFTNNLFSIINFKSTISLIININYIHRGKFNGVQNLIEDLGDHIHSAIKTL